MAGVDKSVKVKGKFESLSTSFRITSIASDFEIALHLHCSKRTHCPIVDASLCYRGTSAHRIRLALTQSTIFLAVVVAVAVVVVIVVVVKLLCNKNAVNVELFAFLEQCDLLLLFHSFQFEAFTSAED